MNQKIAVPTILFVFVLLFSFYAFSREKNEGQLSNSESAQEETQIILFYGNGCPHCAVVDEYLEENKVSEKITFFRKEAWFNRTNAKELEEKASICGIPTDSIGVPFLWDGEKCLVGDVDIVDFFKQKIIMQ